MMPRTFEALCDSDDESFRNADLILILDSCFAGTETRDFDSGDRSVEMIASVEYDHSALGNSSDYARIQNSTFTSRLAVEVAQRLDGRTSHPSPLPKWLTSVENNATGIDYLSTVCELAESE